MARLILVRHGEAAARFDRDLDPGLSPVGQEQADRVAASIAAGPRLPIVTSPLRRTRETARPLESTWGVAATPDTGVSEIPWPSDDLEERGRFLQEAIRGRWADLSDVYRDWRAQVLATLRAMPDDTVVFTHLIAINVAVGAATGDDRLLISHVGNCSCTVVDVDGAAIELAEVGVEADTRIW